MTNGKFSKKWMIQMGQITDEILKAIDIIIDEKVKALSHDRSANGIIIKKTTKGYLVGFEGKKIDCPVINGQEFNINDTVKVVIEQNDYKKAYILGKINKSN